ncbi:conserved hypothetical protein [Rippkaea orientalis PCC 8801]|uniref:Uncharacterized protein n=1 Tax=Rippkaea orientalis (strain PCC 8801 / RF-1) TaxID=41431 RepID=B7JWD9_RIPO1|nr:type V CRISPR-associated protein Cas12k [Rippkaea orientalis]ACK66984.1 conserved hypothetical protein [Rippkaea orientalis PCC 8801]
MTHITVVQCRLIAPESTLQHIWKMMAQQQTPLINQLLHDINTHPDINTWLTANQLPSKLVETLAQPLKTQSPYQGLPGRFITSAIILVKEMYASWFAIQTQKRLSLEGKKRFLTILKSDKQLIQDSQTDFLTLCYKAQQLLKRTQNKLKLDEPQHSEKAHWSIINALYPAYNNAKTPISRAAFALLIKNNGQVPDTPENPDYYQQRRKRKEIQIRRLEEQLKASLPKGRILDSKHWENTLKLAQTPITTIEEITSLQTQLLQKYSHLPFPVFYGTNTDLTWFKNPQGRICVKFNGLNQYPFQIACNKRQYPWFQRFFTDYQSYKSHKQQVPTGLMVLRSARLLWQPTNGQGEPWNTHHLSLHCAIDNDLWTISGIQQVKQQKILQTEQKIANFHSKALEKELTPNQQQRLKASQTSLNLLKTFDINEFFPSKCSLYQGSPDIILGVSIGLENPATIAIINISTQEILTYRTTKQLLSRTRKVRNKKPNSNNSNQSLSSAYKQISNYELFLQYQQQKHHNQHQRHNAQINDANNNYGEANLGLYLNRLLAKAILELAQQYQVSLIILPSLKNKRELIESEIRAKAELKYPGCKEKQDSYAKDYRTNVHQWSYQQLIKCIESKAAQIGIDTATGKQMNLETSQDQARNLVLNFCQKFSPTQV